jgi:hypothetical protein
MDQDIDSARELDRLCKEHDAYRWILGGVRTNYHQLSDFRVQHEQALLAAFEEVLCGLEREGLLTTRRQAQDGARVRASAGAASFRRKKSLRRCLQRARARHAGVKRWPLRSARRQQARGRAWRERTARAREALRLLPQAERAKKAKERAKARVSTTDPETRVMKMGDGGYRPAYNLQFSTTTAERVIVAVRTSNEGSDMGQMDPMRKDLERTGRAPRQHLVDGGFAKLSAIQKAEEAGTRVYAPEQQQKKAKANRPKKSDAPGVARWRRRMARASAKRVYKERASTAELVVADLRSHGLRLRVRGIRKVHQIALWTALAHNLRRKLFLLRQRFKGPPSVFLHSL